MPAILQIIFSLFIFIMFVWGGFFIFRHTSYWKKQMERSLKMIPILLTIPRDSGSKDYEAKSRDDREMMREMVSLAETFYSNMTVLYNHYKHIKNFLVGAPHMSAEIVAKDKEIFFYMVVPYAFLEMAEKALSSQYPDCNLERTEEHNIFNENWGIENIAGGDLRASNSYYYPFRSYLELDSEPLGNITNSFGKLEIGEGAALQIMFRPAKKSKATKVNDIAREMQSGRRRGLIDHLWKIVDSLNSKQPESDLTEPKKITPMEEETIKAIGQKASKPLFETMIRIVVSTNSKPRSEMFSREIASTFVQFNNQNYNSFQYVPARNTEELVTDYIFRFFSHRLFSTNNIFRLHRGQEVYLNTEELASIFHLPNFLVKTPGIRWLPSKKAAPPTFVSENGVVIGHSLYRGEDNIIRISENDRRRHLYILGQTGTGKSTSMINMIISDIRDGKGVCYIDPHGQDLIENVLPYIPKERADDVIIFNASDFERPIGLNLFTAKTQEEKDFVIQESIGMLYRLYDPTHTGVVGPRFEHWFRNAALTLMAGPTPGTFIEIPRIFTDEKFLAEKLQYVTDPIVRNFWINEMAQTSDYHKSEMLGFFIGKFSAFMTNTTMRNILGQTESAIDIRKIMDEGKILLVNLAKGQTGELNMQLLGMILVAKIQMAAMGRVDIPENERRDFYLYVDEFQNFATDSFASILSEARKFRLNLIVANQFIGQLKEEIRDAVFGNVGSLMCFRVGNDDAEYMAKQFNPIFNQQDLINIENYNSVARILIDAKPSRPFSLEGYNYPPNRSVEIGKAIVQLSRLKYGRPRDIVDKEILGRMSIKS